MSDTPAGTFTRPIGAELAGVLAAAARAAFTAPTFYVVARYDPDPSTTSRPFNVQRPVETYADAEALVQDLAKREPGVEYGIFGPFQSEDPERPTSQATVARLEVTTEGGSGPHAPFTIQGHEYDALFYSLQAVEKFVVPYYAAEYGAEFALQVRLRFQQAPLALLGHLPWSEETEVLGQAAGSPQAAAAAAGGAPPAKERFVPVLFHRDAGGQVRAQPLQPPPAR
ncbi:MAG TPA: hypothetical protein VFQ45_17370 [Longimicrobium sp.]|nr:hypothetical protein [Longimicrobium sp.]